MSQHLRVLRETGVATVRADGPRRIYEVTSLPLGEIDAWLARFRQVWTERLDALATEVARGKRERRSGRYSHVNTGDPVDSRPPRVGPHDPINAAGPPTRVIRTVVVTRLPR